MDLRRGSSRERSKDCWVRPVFPALFLLSLCVPQLRAQETICDPGDTEVRNVTFAGNEAFSDNQLAIGIVTTRSSALYRVFRILGSRRCLDREQLPLDAARIARFYRDHGFRDVAVGLDTVPLRPGSVDVNFTIDEGEPIRITRLNIVGLDGVDGGAELRRRLLAGIGDRFDLIGLALAVDRMTTSLRNQGYPLADVLFSYDADFVGREASVDLQVLTGPLTRVGAVLVNVQKDSLAQDREQQISDVAVRRLMRIEPGELVSLQKLLDAQRNLFQTDAYRHVSVRPAPDSLQPEADSLLAVQATLVEGQMADVRAGIGWGTLDCFRAQATYTDRSFLGDARQLELGARVSKIGIGYPLDGAEGLCRQVARDDIYGDTLNYRVGLTLRQPGLFGLQARDAPTITLYSEARSEYLAFFRSVPVGGSAALTMDLLTGPSRYLPLTLSFSVEYGHTQAQPAISCALFNLCAEEERNRLGQSQRLAVVSVSTARDTRDFALDPRRGSLLQAEWRHAGTEILSDPSLQFDTLLGEYRRYWELGGGVVLSARLRGGTVLGRQLAIRVLRSGDEVSEVRVGGYVPPEERLYAGGPNTVRGYRFNELGPRVYIVNSYDTIPATGDTVYLRARDSAPIERAVPTGGNTMVIGSVEARLPSPFLRDLLSYALFVDAGEVWNRGGGAGSEQAAFQQIRITPGFGIRFFSPVGPIRIDVGYNPYKRRAGVAYYDAPVGPGGVAPLYCVSPGNTIKTVLGTGPNDPATQLAGSGECGPTLVPERRRGLTRLTLNLSIGQAF